MAAITAVAGGRGASFPARSTAIAAAPVALATVTGVLLAGHVPAAAFLALAVAIGLPHGAFDHQVGRRAFGGAHGARWWRPFLVGYLALLLATLLAWWAAPGLALLAFLTLSVFHFGEEDAPVGAPFRPLRIAAHGGTVVVVTTAAHPHAVEQLFAILAPPAAARIEALIAGPLLVLWAAAAAGSLALYLSRGRQQDHAAAADLVLVALLFALVPPLVAFSLYFAAIHAPRAFASLRPASLPSGRWLLVPALLTLLGFALAGALYLAGPGATPGEKIVRATFLLLSALTVPHMWLEWRADRVTA